ncbi:hypothetical protein B0T13DRAFT_524248 [Neurospora crassa]|nr:hypothetical protein B0T13DRAFT_524248 [Neurospora crassa]
MVPVCDLFVQRKRAYRERADAREPDRKVGFYLVDHRGRTPMEVVDVSRYGMPADIKQVPIVDSLDSTNGWSFFDEKEEKCEYDRIRFGFVVSSGAGLLSIRPRNEGKEATRRPRDSAFSKRDN